MRRALALAAWLWLASSSGAAAEATAPFAALVPGTYERVAQRARGLEAALTQALESLAGVARARVALDLPDGACHPLDAPLPHASASVLLVMDEDGSVPKLATVQAVVRGAARELADADVRVTHAHEGTHAARSEPLVSVGPFRVARDSASGVRLLLALSLLANVTLATLLLVRLRRKAAGSTSS